jgi:AbrB family looped-hinge helix DNA binding protein
MWSTGAVVIPKHLRDELGFTPGTEVTLEKTDEGILIHRAETERPLGGRFKGSGMAERLLEDRAREPK